MRLANRLAEVVVRVGEAVSILSEKRETLEEKMIRMYLHETAAVAALNASLIHEITGGGAYPDKLILTNLETLVDEVIASLDQFLKMARYNLNYLEQYFEHGYCQKLRYESAFVERLQRIQTNLSDQLATSRK
jgi:hypothetical protein